MAKNKDQKPIVNNDPKKRSLLEHKEFLKGFTNSAHDSSAREAYMKENGITFVDGDLFWETDLEPNAKAATSTDSMGREARIRQMEGEMAALRDALQREKTRADDLSRELPGLQSAMAEGKEQNSRLQVRANLGDRLIATMVQAGHSAAVDRAEEVLQDLLTKPVSGGPSPLPESGWSSPRAKELVENVAPAERDLMLGDLLADLAIFAGETGTKESAQDVLKRRVFEASQLRLELDELRKSYTNLYERERGKDIEISELKAAMVTQRSPGAGAETVLIELGALLADASGVIDGPSIIHPGDLPTLLKRILAEWRGLRELLSKQPMVAVAVRNDSTPQLAERYSLFVLEWDGQKVSPTMLEGPAKPWSDLVLLMRHAVDTRLVPPTFR